MAQDRTCDVLIVGAGPTGSALALFLAQQGVRVLIADKAADIYPLPRAAHIDHETVRIFQALGLAAPIMASCRQAPRYDFVNARGDVLLRFDGADRIGAGGWPAANMIHQPSIERALRDALHANPAITLRTGWTLQALAMDDDGATARFADGADETTVRARFVVGADGTRSATRALAGIALDDLCFDEPWLVIDAIVHDAARLPTINLQICDPARPTTCVLMGSGRHRWEFMLRPGETPEQATDPAFVAALLAPWNVEGAVEVERLAVYRFNARVAHRWRAGPVLLAGDAAHQMPPFAGQGMCSGLRDAANLGWKLAAVVAGDAPATLLDTYQAEREPHVRQIIALAMMMGRTVCELDPEIAAARDVQMIAARAQAGEMRPPAAALANGHLLAGSAAAGDYFPQFLGAAGERLDDVLGTGAWLLADAPIPTGEGGVRAADLSHPALAPFAAAIAEWLRTRDVPAVLVRPDRYVFGTGTPSDLQAAYRFATAAQSPVPDGAFIRESEMSIDGTYDVVVKSPMGERKSVLTVQSAGDRFTGTNAGDAGSFDVSGAVSGNTLTWQQKITTPMPMTLDMTATIEGDTITGSAKAGAFGSFPLSGQRTG